MTNEAKEWANKNSCCIDGGKCCANVTEAFQAGCELGLSEGRKDVTYMKAEEYDEYLNVCRENEQLKKENKLLENTCSTWQEIQKRDNELLHELEKENEQRKKQLTILERRIYNLKIKNASLERKIEKMKNCLNCDKEYTNNPDCKECKYSRKYNGKQDKWEKVI